MGVPKFFRYISERYPCLSEFVKEYQIPIFDNLYLDMNGIIHMCSHPDDNNPHFRITEEKIFADIFHYIEVLFRMIKPQKVFFMAVDGVAPRAKMNQQRGRRFRSAKDAEKLEKEALRKGETLPEVGRFDSNCITPGTEFMARLHEQLKYFVVNKISTDKMWKKCKVILSGHETPGEGEHKIMDYIRYLRSQPGYDPNTRHCLYGLDADLIMLGLCTHEPHFSLLREEVKFGKKSKRTNVPEEIRFYLLHLSLMREYLELEFASLKEKLKSEKLKFDIEKIIDDWILMGFLVGNDFIPNLPNLHIANGALPVLYEAYIEVLPTLDGYINEAGTLNLERFEKFMKKLAEIDVKNFEEIQDDLQYMQMKTGRKHPGHVPNHCKPNKNEDDETGYQDEIRSKSMDPALAQLIQKTNDLDVDSEEESEKSSNEDEAFKSYKDEYYRSKMEFQKVTPEVMRDQAEGYVRAIQWNLHYYYDGVCSWSWFYPHHYSPYISDIKGFSDLKIEFELGKPFKPYEQLLAVLPPASKNFLPKCYHHLMTDDNSVIKGYYPEEFQTDLNGKRQEWEAVVLVPFIDENVLLEAMKPCNKELTLEEIKRNTHGPMLIYVHSEENIGVFKAPNYFPDVENHAHCTPVNVEDIRVPRDKLVKGAYPGAHFDVFYPGFPTMKHLKYESKLKKAKVKVFEMPSRNENMILRILPNELYFGDSIPEDLLGRIVWVGWPHLVEAEVVAISNRKLKCTPTNDENERNNREERPPALFDSELEGVVQHYRDRLGIDFGKTEVLVHVKMMTGRKYVFTSNRRVNLEKQFSTVVSHFPLQSIVLDINVHDECYTTFEDISDVFPVGSSCFSLTNPFYGSQGTIVDNKESSKGPHLKVCLNVLDEPDFSSAQKIDEKLKSGYLTLANSASQLALSNYVFSRVTGSLFISARNAEGSLKSVNIGLDLKFNKKNQETPGYTRKIVNVWFYTNKAVTLVREYIEKFPEVFRHLSENNADEIVADEMFGENDESDEKVKIIQNWLKTLPTHNIERRVCGSSVLEPEVIAAIEKIVDEAKTTPKNITLQIKPQLLFKPEIQMGNLTPDCSAETRVFDRVVNIREGFTVPLGLKGTVIAVHKPANGLTDSDEMYDIVFDKAFTGGMALNCSEHRGYRLPKTSFINITHGKRQMEQKTGVPGALRAKAKERQNTSSFHINPNNNANVNERQQNSAFASFNKTQSNYITPSFHHNKNSQYQTRSQQQQQHVNSTVDQNKINKNSFYFMADYSQKYEVKINKENGLNQRNSEVHGQKKPVLTATSNSQQRSHKTLQPRAEVDTDFLRKILKIEKEKPTGTNKPKSGQTVQTQAGPSKSRECQNKESSTASASARLLSYYQSNSLGCPRYTYLRNVDGVCAQVALPNGKVICGRNAKSREEASENVAVDALNILKNLSLKSAKQGPPDFPVPPMKWVQQQNKSQVFVNNRFSQAKQQNHHQRAANLMEHSRKGSRNQGDSTNVNTPTFVPLQALKKRQTSKLVNADRDANGTSSRAQCTIQELNSHSSVERVEKSEVYVGLRE
ncbi:5'-3' exoribonuclease 1 like, partial [Asbolus verrucosus]